MVTLVDIDHTLADSFWRDGMIGASTWDEYHKESERDEAIDAIRNLVEALHLDGHVIVGLTSRPEKFRHLTMRWMLRHKIPMDELLMRENDDYRRAPEIKMDLVRKRFGENFKEVVDLLIEDRDDVIEAFRNAGVHCLQFFSGSSIKEKK